ncbi:hypothetical protein Cgig2_025786 [Carnegiea gigantea]|uniref:Zinc finger GRF-type domain-containing protein n=1 Tax=Carnegiea gigantea TaxID=171969 RepID=A0A9Q1JQV5_9CARY|nr:hypothetical protein Cgig2_025786 [Carnegiea gigantea]
MLTSSKSGPCCPEPKKICNYGRRCKVATSMTLKNPIHRFVHCRNYGGGGGCDYFEWIDESLDERVRSMAVGLMVSNDTMAAEIKRLENDLEAQKHEVKKLNEKNQRMKLKLYAWQRSFFLDGWTIYLCSIVAAVPPLFATVCPACVVATVNGVKTVALFCTGSIGSDLICRGYMSNTRYMSLVECWYIMK